MISNTQFNEIHDIIMLFKIQLRNTLFGNNIMILFYNYKKKNSLEKI